MISNRGGFSDERSACGVGFIVNRSGHRSHEALREALEALERLEAAEREAHREAEAEAAASTTMDFAQLAEHGAFTNPNRHAAPPQIRLGRREGGT